jgi:hypothetical protein
MAFYIQLRQLAVISILLLIVGVHGRRCSNPAVRREWRTLSRSERADWINAVKVTIFFCAPVVHLTQTSNSASLDILTTML